MKASFVNKKDGKIIKTMDVINTDIQQIVPNNYKLPRVFGIKNVEGNEDLYENLLNQVGKTLRVESDQINGLFNIGLDGEEIVLRESL